MILTYTRNGIAFALCACLDRSSWMRTTRGFAPTYTSRFTRLFATFSLPVLQIALNAVVEGNANVRGNGNVSAIEVLAKDDAFFNEIGAAREGMAAAVAAANVGNKYNLLRQIPK
jgi:hypothetical protein